MWLTKSMACDCIHIQQMEAMDQAKKGENCDSVAVIAGVV